MIVTPPAPPAIHAGWSGIYTLPAGTAPVAITIRVSGGTATVALGAGHAGVQRVRLTRDGTHVRFAVPGLPRNVVFDGTVGRARLAGAVRQGKLRGTFNLHRGAAPIVALLGAYRSVRGAEVAILEADGLAPFLVELPSGATHGIGATLTVGRRLGDTRGNGLLAVDSTGFSWRGTHYTRVALPQREVRVGVDGATLTLPLGKGPFPAVAMVHGSGARTRDEFDIFTVFLALRGIAVLADDKRGVGQSAGPFPGESASDYAIDLLARDAQRQVRFLARLAHIDHAGIGLFGDSQAGWVIPLAASRERLARWAILNSGPTVTVGETDVWQTLAGQSETRPSGTREHMLEQLRQSGRSGFDPEPYLRKLSIPALWMFGSDDRNVPTELCLERLGPLERDHDYSTVVLSTAHTPLVLPTGLLSSLPRSPGFDPRFFPSMQGWLNRHGLVR